MSAVYDRSRYNEPHVLLVPVETAGRAVRLNINMQEGLLSRLDEIARRSGTTRSALLARGAKLVLAAETET